MQPRSQFLQVEGCSSEAEKCQGMVSLQAELLSFQGMQELIGGGVLDEADEVSCCRLQVQQRS